MHKSFPCLVFLWVLSCLSFTALKGQIFPHFGVGGEPQSRIETIVQMVNAHSTTAAGEIIFYNDLGAPVPVSVDGAAETSTFSFSLPPGAARQYVLTKAGSVVGGWFRITFSTPSVASANAVFRVYQGAQLFEAGVLPASEVDAAELVFDSEGPNLDTGLAVANPSNEVRTFDLTLWAPDGGVELSSTTVELPPHGHIARFVTEFFDEVPNVAELRAQLTVEVRDGKYLPMVALRSNQGKLTTIPTESPYSLILPQIGVGGSPTGIHMETIVYLTSRESSSTMSGNLSFFDDEGQPLSVSVNGGPPATSQPFQLPPHHTERIVLSGNDQVRSGWLDVTDLMEDTYTGYASSMAVSAVFQIHQKESIVSEAGVLPATSGTTKMTFVDYRNQAVNTGLALVNPDWDAGITIWALLYRANGTLLGETSISLPPGGHRAAFVSELFPAVVGEGSNGFEGSLSLHGPDSFSAVALYQKGAPVIAVPVHDAGVFSPTIVSSRLVSSKASPLTLECELDIVDKDRDLVNPETESMELMYLLLKGFSLYIGWFTVSAPELLGVEAATLTITIEFSNLSASSGSTAILLLWVEDQNGNSSNSTTFSATF